MISTLLEYEISLDELDPALGASAIILEGPLLEALALSPKVGDEDSPALRRIAAIMDPGFVPGPDDCAEWHILTNMGADSVHRIFYPWWAAYFKQHKPPIAAGIYYRGRRGSALSYEPCGSAEGVAAEVHVHCLASPYQADLTDLLAGVLGVNLRPSGPINLANLAEKLGSGLEGSGVRQIVVVLPENTIPYYSVRCFQLIEA